MDNWLKGLIATACVVVIGAAGHYFWTARFAVAQISNRHVSERMRDRCEKDYRFVVDPSNAPIAEVAGRYFAIMFTDCEEFGVFSSRQLRNIQDSEVGALWTAYKEDPSIWNVD